MAANKPKEIVVVGSKIKEVIREAGLRSDGELVSAVSEKVHEMLQAAIHRCTSNGRSTVRPHDLGSPDRESGRHTRCTRESSLDSRVSRDRPMRTP